MALSKGHKANFETIIKAAKAGDLALLECTEQATGKRRAVICAVVFDGKEHLITPFCHLSDGNPYEEYVDPSSD